MKKFLESAWYDTQIIAEFIIIVAGISIALATWPVRSAFRKITGGNEK